MQRSMMQLCNVPVFEIEWVLIKIYIYGVSNARISTEVETRLFHLSSQNKSGLCKQATWYSSRNTKEEMNYWSYTRITRAAEEN